MLLSLNLARLQLIGLMHCELTGWSEINIMGGRKELARQSGILGKLGLAL